MDRREEILRSELKSAVFSGLDRTIISAPFNEVFNAMDENGKRLCLELLEYMANHGVRITHNVRGTPVFEYKGEWITKEALFENFL